MAPGRAQDERRRFCFRLLQWSGLLRRLLAPTNGEPPKWRGVVKRLSTCRGLWSTDHVAAARIGLVAGLLGLGGCRLTVVTGGTGDYGGSAGGFTTSGRTSGGETTGASSTGSAATSSNGTGSGGGTTGGSTSGGGGCLSEPTSVLQTRAMYTSLAFTQIASRDLNGDGVLDLVATRSADFPPGVGFDVFFGQADGGLSLPTSYAGSDGYALAVGDLNGDGWPDVVVSYGAEVVLFMNDGTGKLKLSAELAASEQVFDVGIGDINADGYADLALAEFGREPSVELILGEGAGTFLAPVTLPKLVGADLGGLVVGDLNQDGLSDIVLSIAGGTSQLAVFISQGDGGFSLSLYPTPVWGGMALLPEANAAPDLLLAGFPFASVGTVQVLKNSGYGTFSIGPSYATPGGSALTVGDFNGDCIPDIATSNAENCEQVIWGISVLYGESDGGFEPAESLQYAGTAPGELAALGPVGGRNSLAVGDLCGAGVTVYSGASKH
jgi:hypothetical protein